MSNVFLYFLGLKLGHSSDYTILIFQLVLLSFVLAPILHTIFGYPYYPIYINIMNVKGFVSINFIYIILLLWQLSDLAENDIFLITSFILLCFYVFWMKRSLLKFKSEIIGKPEVNLLFLRTFGMTESLFDLDLKVGTFWRVQGNVYRLKGFEDSFFIGTNYVLSFLRRRDKFLANKPEEVKAKISKFKRGPNILGYYYKNELFCNNAMWQLAFSSLLQHSNVILMDLTAFTRKNKGCIYELNQLICNIPTNRFVILIDPATDTDFLIMTLRHMWVTMDANSPNRKPDVKPLQIYRLTRQYKMGHLINQDRRDSIELNSSAKDIINLRKILCQCAFSN